MINRPARTKLVATIEDFLHERIGAFEFDERLFEMDSDDPIVQFARDNLWFLYDDLTDHLVAARKLEWDFMQRLLLVLTSDREVFVSSKY